MPKGPLTMGLLDKVPLWSPALRRFAKPRYGKNYTDFQKMHMTALYFTPGISHTWLMHQFEQLGLHPETALRRLTRIAYANREQWEHLGQENVLLMGQPEVERFLLRRPMHKRAIIPNWCLPVFNDHVKQGWTKVRIAEHYRLHPKTLDRRMRASMFIPQYPGLVERGTMWGKKRVNG